MSGQSREQLLAAVRSEAARVRALLETTDYSADDRAQLRDILVEIDAVAECLQASVS